MLFANSDHDTIFPMDGNRRIIERLRKAYSMYGKLGLVDEHVSPGGHDYRRDLRVAIFSFINKHLKGDAAPVQDVTYTPLPGKQLRAFPEDGDLPKDALNDKIDEMFVPPAKAELPEAGKFAAWKEKMIGQLRAKSFRAFPERIRVGQLVHAVADDKAGWRFITESGIAIRVQWEEGDPKKPNVWIVLNDDDPKEEQPKWAENLFEGECFMCAPRGLGVTAWTRKNPPNYVERSFPLLGLTVDEMRVWDAIASFREWYRQAPERTWLMAGRKQAGVIAAYAAIFEPEASGAVLIDPPSSHRDGPQFLNVLRVIDIPEALGLLAPRPLTIYSNDKTFERTAELYKRAGAGDKFKQLPLKK
jgi:hypothetical protein